MAPVKISVIGAGFVGAAVANTLLASGLASEIVLVDKNREKAVGESLDIGQSAPFVKPTDVYAGDESDCKGSSIIVFTAGANQGPNETRLDLSAKNAEIIKDSIPKLVASVPEAIFLMVTNPVDVMTYLALKTSGLPKEKVIGSGTILDTSRFRYSLSNYLQVDARNIHAYIVGEHGDSEVALWSMTNVAGIGLEDFCHLNNLQIPEKAKILEEVKNAAYKIIETKGATYYAISYGVRRICEAILRDERSVLTVSSLVDGIYGIKETCLTLPCIVSRKGVEKVINLSLSEDEQQALIDSANVIKKYQDAMKL